MASGRAVNTTDENLRFFYLAKSFSCLVLGASKKMKENSVKKGDLEGPSLYKNRNFATNQNLFGLLRGFHWASKVLSFWGRTLWRVARKCTDLSDFDVVTDHFLLKTNEILNIYLESSQLKTELSHVKNQQKLSLFSKQSAYFWRIGSSQANFFVNYV